MLTNPVSSHNPDSQANAVCDAFEQWFADHISESPGNTSLLRTFIRSFISYFETFNGGMQDQHEYLMLLLKILHDCRSSPCMFNITGQKNGPWDDLEEKALHNLRQDGMWTSFDNLTGESKAGWNSVIFGNFTGQFHARTRCDCGYVSDRFETFKVLEVDLNKDSLEDCLNWTTRETTLEDENAYECDKCKRFSRAFRRIMLWRLPRVLVFSLKRFVATFKHGQIRLDKNNANIEIPQKLDMTAYLSVPRVANTYELYAIAHHVGNQQGGHCYSYLKAPDGQWFAVDDAKVLSLKNPSFNGSTPYLLFYRSVT